MAGAWDASALKGTSSSASSSARLLSTVGSAWCESTCVSPWPGKCFTQQATPSRNEPRIQAAASRLTSTGSFEKLRSPMTGLAGLLLTSSTGAKFQLIPSDLRPRATAAPTASARSASPLAPSAMAEGGCGRKVTRTTAPPSWSMPISASGPSTSMRSRISAPTSASVPMFLRNRQTERIFCARRKAAVSASRRVPGMSTITRRPGSKMLMSASMGFRHFGEVGRHVGIETAGPRQGLHHRVEALHQRDGVEVFVAGGHQRQLGARRAQRGG